MKIAILVSFLILLNTILQAQTTYTFNYTGSVQTWTVPDAVTAISLDVYGAAGGDGAQGRTGGYGGYSKGYMEVTPGQILNIYVGGQGGTINTLSSYGNGGYNGGGNCYLGPEPRGPVGAGGGGSDVRVSPYALSDRVIVAGGGGGAAGSGWIYGSGGYGGGLVGETTKSTSNYNDGGTQTAGGTNHSNSNYNGHIATGGNVASNYYHSSGGGGGYYGGAAGICSGGAGGSGYIGGVINGSTTADQRSGNGLIIIKTGILQYITFNKLDSVTYGTSPFIISATGGGSGNPVIFTSSDPTIAKCSGTNGTTITILKAGTCSIYANQAGNTSYFVAPQVSQVLTVKPKAVTVTGVIANNKIYNGTSAALFTVGSINGIVNGDIITLLLNGNFDDKNVGYNKTATVTGYVISGTKSSCYYLDALPSNLTANITAKPLSVINASIVPKQYDGNSEAYITGATLSGVENLDTLLLKNETYGTFNQTDIGTNIPVASAMTITGPSAHNYSLTQPILAGEIITKELSVINASVSSKMYDGNTNATISGAALSGIVGLDTVELENDTIGTFEHAYIGSFIPVSTAMTISGANAYRYSLVQPYLFGDILIKELTVINAVISKSYDGKIGAIITGATLSGVVGEDLVMLENDTSGTYSQVNVGTNIPVSTSMFISGPFVNRYSLIQPSLKGTITPAKLTATANNCFKLYGDPNPPFTITYTGFVNDENEEFIDIKPIATCSAITSSLSGDYDINIANGKDNNYDFIYIPGKLTISPITGLINAKSEEYSIYPNPCSDYLIIKSKKTDNITVKVFDMSGRLIIEKRTINNQLDIRNLTSGLYNIIINGYSFKLVKI
jgi:hypothetical protein